MEKISQRRAVERLRGGLLDSTAVQRLTMESELVVKAFSKGLKTLEKGQSAHLCICGSYGQGKSHNLNYLQSQAISQGYATSFVQLDLREIPFHQFSTVYKSLIEKLTLPDNQSFVDAWKQFAPEHQSDHLNSMPHRFQMILQAMVLKNRPSNKKQKTKKEVVLRPKEVASMLERAFMGYQISTSYFKQVLKAFEIEGYNKESLVCKGNAPYIQLVQAFGGLLKEMGYKGLILFFDEAEAIAQGRIGARVKSYDILHQFFDSKQPVYPVFAFTEDFFEKIKFEDYTNENRTFPQNYSEVWKDLNIVRLKESSSKEWEGLQNRLIQLYAEAYQIDLSSQVDQIKQKLKALLEDLQGQETRYKLKAFVHLLDIETQNRFL